MVYASADMMGEELVQSDDHGGWRDGWTSSRDVQLIAVVSGGLLVDAAKPGS